ncbi:MAG: hypothetical protein HZT42_05855 [Paracoccaceae bacterium]|nr:MAG: hypothetical protein HZT42_05855 [Paracoccaceae bacterium]
MNSLNLQRKHQNMLRMSRHRLRIHNNKLVGQLHASGMDGSHTMRRDDGIVWLYLKRTEGNVKRVKECIREYELENGIGYELLMNPKGFNPKYDWVWVVPKHETFYRVGDEKHEGASPRRK